MAVVLAWLFSALLSRRVQRIAAVARRYSEGDLTRPVYDYGSDELGAVARVLDSSVQELGRRIEELSRDRARMEAILSGMVEGVLVVDRQGRLQLVNRAAQDMLHVDASATGRPYLEVIRHPDIAAQLAAALRGESVDSRELALLRDPARTFVARAAPVASAGGGGAVLVLHDITDLRRADQIRRDFVANVSHELRTPLTAIRGYVEALLDEAARCRDNAAVSRDHRASQHAHGAAGQGSPAPRAAGRAPGSPGDDARATRSRSSTPSSPTWRRPSRPSASRSRSPSSPTACIAPGRPGQAPRHRPQPASRTP